MKKQLVLLFFAVFYTFQLAAQCHNLTLPYGIVQTDINRGYKIIATQDGNFVVAGEWNNEAYLLKFNSEGQQLAFQKFGPVIGGESKFRDLVEAPDGGFVAVGQCDNCTTPNDSLIKVVVLKTDANLNLDTNIGVKKFGAATQNGITTIDERVEPSIVRTGTTYVMAAAVNVGGGLNPQDVVVTKLSEMLEPIWDKMYHTGFFEAPYDITATGDGFIIPVNRAFVATAILLKIDLDGNQLWARQFAITPARNIVYLPATNETVVVGSRVRSDDNRDAFLMLFNAATGAAVDSLLWGEALGDEGYDIHLLGNGDLQAGVRTNLPNPFGAYATSRIYRVQSHPLQVICYEKIPNPDNITNITLTSIVPLSNQGKDFVATGIRGFYNRTFFHIRENCEINYTSASICSGENYTLPDGQTVSNAGVYESTVQGVTGCDSIIQTSLSIYPEIALTTLQVHLCAGDTHTLPNGHTVGISGVYSTTLQTSNGCDSLIQTTVVVSALISVDSVHIQHDTGSGNGAIGLQQISGGTTPYAFQWSNNATGSAIGGLTPGIYEVSVQDALGCLAVFSFTIDMQVATEELQSDLAFMLYPNPFAERIEVLLEMDVPSNARYELRFTDAQGRLCRSYTLRQGVSELLDSGSLPVGVYWAQLLENGKVLRNSRILKQ